MIFRISNSSKFVQSCFSDVSYVQPMSDNLQLSQWRNNLKMHSLKYLAKFSRIYFSLPISLFLYQLERSSIYQTTKVFLAFISITSAPFNIDWLAKFWRWMALFGSFEFNINITSFNVIVNNFQLWSIIVLYLRLCAKCEM